MSLFAQRLIVLGLLTENVQTPHLGIQNLSHFILSLPFYPINIHLFLQPHLISPSPLSTTSTPYLHSASISLLRMPFSWLCSNLTIYPTQFLKACSKCPLFSQTLSWIGYSIVISSFSGLFVTFTLSAVLLATFALFCSLTFHIYIFVLPFQLECTFFIGRDYI